MRSDAPLSTIVTTHPRYHTHSPIYTFVHYWFHSLFHFTRSYHSHSISLYRPWIVGSTWKLNLARLYLQILVMSTCGSNACLCPHLWALITTQRWWLCQSPNTACVCTSIWYAFRRGGAAADRRAPTICRQTLIAIPIHITSSPYHSNPVVWSGALKRQIKYLIYHIILIRIRQDKGLISQQSHPALKNRYRGLKF